MGGCVETTCLFPFDTGAISDRCSMQGEAMPDEEEPYDVEVGDWYCEQCDEYLLPCRVTNDERCDTCGGPVEWLEYLE